LNLNDTEITAAGVRHLLASPYTARLSVLGLSGLRRVREHEPTAALLRQRFGEEALPWSPRGRLVWS
jgi:hypothetical protein